jgi:hypothetical protein
VAVTTWPDFTKRSNAIAILLGLTIFFFCMTFLSFMLMVWTPKIPPRLPELCAAAFYGASQSLMLALKMGGPDTPTLPDATGGTVQQTTTVQPDPTQK